MSTEKLVEKIPDIHFDWYARLIPGAIAVAFYFYATNATPTIKATYVFMYAALAYIAGHVAQPAASFFVQLLQRAVKTNEKYYVTAKQNNTHEHLTALVSKAYAEAVGMLSTSLLLLFVLFFTQYKGKLLCLVVAAIVYFFGASVERVIARKRKIDDLPKSNT